MPKISVVMPAYNAEKYIAEAIDSILNQTFRDFEFIILDDGSTDRTAEIVRSFTDPRIRFIQNEYNLGVAVTLNRGLDLAQGEYIARMDSDDISLPERFEKQVAFMDEHPAVAVLGTGIEKFGAEQGVMLFSKNTDDLKIDLLFASCFAHPTVMIRAFVIHNCGCHYDPSFTRMEDYDLWDRLSEYYFLAALPEVMLRYRVHASQVTYQRLPEDEQQIRKLKVRQLARLEIDPDADQLECFIQYCRGNLMPTNDNVSLLCSFFETLKRKNGNTGIYDEQRLSNYLKGIAVSLLNQISFSDAIKLSSQCNVSLLPYAVERISRRTVARMDGAIRKRKLQSRLKSKNFSIISNNCWGGFIYQEFGLKYNTPTIGLYILGSDFVKLAANLDHYMEQELVFIPWEQSTYYPNLQQSEPYPVARLDDIEIYFMHYHSEEEAREKWNRRKKRINRGKLLFKLSEREGCTAEDVKEFMSLPLKNRICFSYDEVERAIHVPELEGLVGDETPIIDRYYDIVELLNGIR